jgi:2-C-methyl-D-erythritol 4-phosphate cytidylyltransferase
MYSILTAPTPSGAYIAHTPRSFHTFDLKQHAKKEFNKRPSEKIKLVAVLEDQDFLQIINEWIH